ncbi:MAG: hypothetical protein AAGU75_23925 [Bacillota bacterium]
MSSNNGDLYEHSQIKADCQSQKIIIADQLLLENMKLIKRMRKLKENWDGYGALAIEKTIIDETERLLRSLEYQPILSPTGRGSIDLTFENNDDVLNYEIFPDMVLKINIYNKDYNNAMGGKYTIEHISKIREEVISFYESGECPHT